MNPSDDKIKFPQPYKVLTAKPSFNKYLKYLMFFGPGAIVASLTIGQGQIILGPQIGAWAGFSLLWLITISIGSYIIAYVGCRFTMLSGIGVMDLFAEKTKKGWMNWFFIIVLFIFLPIFTATIISSLGQAIAWIVGFGSYIIWGIIFCTFAGILVLLGRYKIIEISQAIFVAVLAIGAVISVISFKPDIIEILPNFFTIGQNVPSEYPKWVVTNYPGVTKTSIPFYMLGYMGTLTFTLITLIGYLGWIKVKKWGVFKDCEDPESFSQSCLLKFKKSGEITYLPTSNEEIRKGKILLKPLLIDLSLAFIIVSIVSAAYMIAGAVLLGPIQTLPSDAKLIEEQVIIFEYLANWLKPIFQICVVFALFGTVYAGFEAATRMLYETSKNISKRVYNFEYKRFMLYFLMYLLVVSIPLSIRMYVDPNFSILFFLSITLLFVGVIGVILYGAGVLYLSQKFLPKEYKLGPIGTIISIIAILLLAIPLVFLFI